MKMLDLMLHSGAYKATRDEVDKIGTPDGYKAKDKKESTHFPIAHMDLVTRVTGALERSGMTIQNEAMALHKTNGIDGARFFGLFQVGGKGMDNKDYSTVLGLRNSHDRQFPAGLVMGSGVFVCDNLCFSGEVKIARKHTRHIMRDLPNLIEAAMGKLMKKHVEQARRIEVYKNTEFTDTQAHDLLVQSLDSRIVPVTKLPKVLEQWRTPNHAEFAEGKTAWRLMNAYTEVLKDSSLFNRPRSGDALHGLLDVACGLTSDLGQKTGMAAPSAN